MEFLGIHMEYEHPVLAIFDILYSFEVLSH